MKIETHIEKCRLKAKVKGNMFKSSGVWRGNAFQVPIARPWNIPNEKTVLLAQTVFILPEQGTLIHLISMENVEIWDPTAIAPARWR